MAFLAEERISYSAIKCFLSTLQHVHIRQSFGISIAAPQPCFELVLQRVRLSMGGAKRQLRLHITPEVLTGLRSTGLHVRASGTW